MPVRYAMTALLVHKTFSLEQNENWPEKLSITIEEPDEQFLSNKIINNNLHLYHAKCAQQSTKPLRNLSLWFI